MNRDIPEYVRILMEIAKCQECKKIEYCKRLFSNDMIKDEIRKNGKCPDFGAI
jgi:hypothetical protein